MEKLSRYILVLVTIAVLSFALPKLYWLAFEKPFRVPFIQYSAISDDFLISRNNKGTIRSTSDGSEISRQEYERNLPFRYTKQLVMDGTLPDTVGGVQMDLHQINKFMSTFRLEPKDVDAPVPGLFPLFESQSGRATLEMPDDLFRITWRMEFIETRTRKIDEEKSRMFSAVLYRRGFQFPAKSIDGIPSPRKSCDEGYLLTDNADQLFHIKMEQGKPFVRKVELPRGMKFKAICCVDFNDKLHYAFLFSEDNQLYALTQYDYLLEHFPVGEIDPEKYGIRIYGDLLHYNIQTIGDDLIRSVVLDRHLKKVAEYSEVLPTKFKSDAGRVADVLFCAQSDSSSPYSSYVNFYLRPSRSLWWLLPALLLVLLQLIIIRMRKQKISGHMIDLLLIGLSGIFGFLAVNIFPNRFYD